MKRITAVLAVLAMISLVGCNNKKDEEKPAADATSAVTDIAGGDVAETTETTENPTETWVTTAVETATEATTVATTDDDKLPDVDSPDFEEKLDKEVIEAAQELYEKACTTEWEFTLGSPYVLDMNEYITNEYDWRFCLVTDENINSIADVKADFHKVFSNDYNDNINELYREKDGRVYCLVASRGSNIFYQRTEIAEITDRSEGKIEFKAVSYYDERDVGGTEVYTEEEKFVIIREDDGEWKVQTFKLPY